MSMGHDSPCEIYFKHGAPHIFTAAIFKYLLRIIIYTNKNEKPLILTSHDSSHGLDFLGPFPSD